MHTLRHNPPWGKARDQPTDPRFTHTRQPYQEHAGPFPADTGISPSCSQERWPEDREHQRRRHGAAATAEPAQRNSDDPDPALPAVGQRPAGCQPRSPRLDQGRPCPCTRRYASPLHGKSNAFAGTGSSRTGPACPCAVRTSGSTEDAVRACHPPWLRPPQNQHSPSPALPYIHVAPPAPPPGPRSAPQQAGWFGAQPSLQSRSLAGEAGGTRTGDGGPSAGATSPSHGAAMRR